MSVGTSRPSGQAPVIIVDAYAANIGTLTSGGSNSSSSVNAVASSEMVLQMLDTLMTGHEPFYADYPAYQEAEPLTSHHPHHQHSHHHAITRNNTSVVPPVSLDATTHTPGTYPSADFHSRVAYREKQSRRCVRLKRMPRIKTRLTQKFI